VPEITLVIPIYNEEPNIGELFARLDALVGRLPPCEIILVDDGSRDRSAELVRERLATRPHVGLARLSRNFGHQAAVTAGYDLARGNAVICMDADLQDPPELVLDMIARWREGYHVVYGLRTARRGEGPFKRFTAWCFYRLMRRLVRFEIPLDAGDFRLVDRQVIHAFSHIREGARYLRGLFAWVGFRHIGVPFERPERFAGETKYTLSKMLRLAFDGMLSFSSVPLRLALVLGFLVSGLSFACGVAALAVKIGGFYTVDGWTSLAVLVAFIGGVQLTVMGLIGEYISRIYEEAKYRPIYIVMAMEGGALAGPRSVPPRGVVPV
jgi:dolichol-phosphate mannosyltransferase